METNKYITEPNMEKVRKKVYDEWKKVYDESLSEVEDLAYKLYSPKIDEAYQRGLKDAWECAKKISIMDSPTRDEIFGLVITSNIIDENSAPEAIEKIRQYEQEHEKIKVGDEVIGIYSSGEQTKPFVITKWDSNYYIGIYSDSGKPCQGGLKLQKTGRHFPEIAEAAEVLRKMQEEKE